MIYQPGNPQTEFELAPGYVERFKPGAFKLAPQVRSYFNHNKEKLLGVSPDSLSVWADEKGLHYEATLSDTSWERDLVILMEAGKVKESSIAFVPVKTKVERANGIDIRWIEEAMIYQVDPVFDAAYKGTEAALRDREALKLDELKLWEEKLQRIKDTLHK